MSTQPTDAELIAELEAAGVAFMKFRGGLGGTKEVWTTSGSQDAKKIAQGMRAAIAKWGQSAQAADPLTYEQILALWSGEDQRGLRPVLGSKKVLAFARAIEAAHGIKGGQS